MSEVNKSKTLMINPILDKNGKELLIKTKFISKEIIDHEKSYFEYEKLKHKLKKRLREKIIDEFALKISENESKKDIYTFASVNVKCDSRGLYHRLKKINENQNKNVQNKLKAYFKIWLYQTPNALIKNKINKNSKNDRNRTIKIKYYSYQNVRYSNIAQKTTDMTTRKNRQKIQIQTPINKKFERIAQTEDLTNLYESLFEEYNSKKSATPSIFGIERVMDAFKKLQKWVFSLLMVDTSQDTNQDTNQDGVTKKY